LSNYPDSFGTDYPFVKPGNIGDFDIQYDNEGLSESGLSQNRIVPENSILMVAIGGSIGKVGIVNRVCSRNQQINYITVSEDIDPKYVFFLLKSPQFQEQVIANASTMTMPILNKSKWESLPVAIPPLTEQKRIVAKVDELMALCDRYEAAKATRDTLRQNLRKSAIDALMNAPDDRALKDAWSIVQENWVDLNQEPEDILNFRKIVLELAIQGKLEPQNPKDQSSQLLLAEIQAEQNELIKSGQIKKESSLPQISSSSHLNIPKTWKRCYFQDLKIFGPRNGYSPKAVDYPTAVRSITLTATTSGKFNSKYFKYLDEVINQDSYLWLQPGDLLIQRSNTLAYVGSAAVYEGKSGEFIFPDLIMRVRLSEQVDVRYIHLCLISKSGREHFQNNASGTSGTMPKINQKVVNSLVIPLPPLPEQKRIVAKVEQLMTLCDTLETHLRDTQAKAKALAGAVSGLVVS
jgi:type I restriction enzyme, S subunit